MEYEIVHEFPPLQTEVAWREPSDRLEFPTHYDAPEYFLEPHPAGNSPSRFLRSKATEWQPSLLESMIGMTLFAAYRRARRLRLTPPLQ